MESETRVEILLHALRWGLNSIGEAASNHGPEIPDEARGMIRDGIGMLWEAERVIRGHLYRKGPDKP